MRRLMTVLAAVAVAAAACTNTPEVVTPSRSSLPAPTTESTTTDSDFGAATGSSTTLPPSSTSTDDSASSSTTASASPTTADASDTTDSSSAGTEESSDTTEAESETLEPVPTTTAPDGRLIGSYTVEVVATAPHDPAAYTQGLELHGGRLLESTGRRGESDRRWIDPSSGDVIEIETVGADLFAEGLAIVGDEAYQLTYTAGIAIVFDLETLDEQRVLRYDGEGWGLCHNGSELAMSNGTDVLTFRDPLTFAVTRQVSVRLNGDAVAQLNELECANGQVLANVYGIDQIVAIDPSTGEVEAIIDASPLRPSQAPAEDLNYVLNGIAHSASTGTFYLTGKWWPTLYEVRFVAA